jgi:YegS/Rv2252/BmrU family lipid kinase
MRNILYIINPIAGTSAKKNLRQQIEEKTRGKKIPFEIISSAANGDYSFLHNIIEKKKVTDVVIAGGDGTVNQVVRGLLMHPVNFGIIPCGSGNGLAYAAKIPKQYSQALDIIFNGKAEAVDGFYINDHFGCMLAGLGFDAKVAEDFAQQPKRGLMTYLQLTLKNFLFSKTYSFGLELLDKQLETDAYFISIANSNQFGNNLSIAPRASLSDGLLDVVILTRQNKMSFAFNTLKQIGGWNKLQPATAIEKNKAVIYFQTEKLSIINHSHAPLHIDGEPAAAPEKINIAVKKKCFRLLQPRKD